MLKKNIVRDVALLFVLSLIPMFWFKEGCFIASGDVAQYLDLSNLMRFFPWSWDERIAAGEPCLSTTFSLPYGYFWLILKALGVHLIAIEKMWVFLTFFASAVSMYVFMRRYVDERESWAPLFSGVVYSYNLFLVVAPLLVQYNLAPLYMFGPLAFSFWVRGLSAESGLKKCGYAGLLALSSLLYAHANVNAPHVAAFVVIVIIYTGYHLVFLSKTRFRDVVFVCGAILLYLCINAWWMVSSLLTMFQMSDVVQGTRSGWHLLWATHLADAFRFLGFWAWTHKHNDIYYFPFNESYASWPLIICSYGVIFIALSAVLLRKKKVIFPLLVLVVGLFLVKGGTGPLGSFYEYCWKNVRGLWIFREPWSKFTHINVFAVSVLFGIAASTIYEKVRGWASSMSTPDWWGCTRKPAAFLYPIVIIVLVLITAYPAVTGQVIWDQYNYNVRSMQVKVPDYWPRLGEWFLKNDPHARVFLLPKTGYARGPYDWESGFTSASTAAISFLPNQLAYYTDFPTTRAHMLFNDLFAFFTKDNKEDIAAVLKALAVKYVLQQNDVSWKYTWPENLSPEQMRAVLQGRPELRFKERFGKLDLYEVRDPGTLFSTTPRAVLIGASKTTLYDLAKKNGLWIPHIMDDGDQLPEWMRAAQSEGRIVEPADGNTTVIQTAGEENAIIKNILRIHPAKYILSISAQGPFWLVFNESYHPGWQATIDETGRRLRPMIERSALLSKLLNGNERRTVDRHVRVNDYANGWYIGRSGDFNLIVEYGPQRMYEFAKLLSWCVGLLCIAGAARAFCTREDRVDESAQRL